MQTGFTDIDRLFFSIFADNPLDQVPGILPSVDPADKPLDIRSETAGVLQINIYRENVELFPDPFENFLYKSPVGSFSTLGGTDNTDFDMRFPFFEFPGKLRNGIVEQVEYGTAGHPAVDQPFRMF